MDASLYRLVLRPAGDGFRGVAVDTAEGPVPLATGGGGDTFSDIGSLLREAEIVVVSDDEGPDAREDGTQPATPAGLRERIIARDGASCRACGARDSLRVHHMQYRSDGGPTKAFNLITLCLPCHSLVHADLLVLDGKHAEGVVFRAPGAEPLRLADESPAGQSGNGLGMPALRAPVITEASEEHGADESGHSLMTFDRLPAVIDGAWWERHAHLMRYRKGTGLEFRAGEAIAPAAGDSRADASPATIEADPHAFDGILGQAALVDRLKVAAGGSRHFGTPFPHTCFVGPAGTGKTTLARRISRACGARLVSTSGPVLEGTHTLSGLLATLQEFDMLFLDEIHAVPPAARETLYEALAARRLELTLRSGTRVRTVELRLPAFTLLAATTEEGRLHDALRSRFGLLESLGHYEVPALAALATARAEARGFCLVPPAASTLAAHARGIPREALRLMDRVLEYAAQSGLPSGGRAGRYPRETRLDDDTVRAALLRLGYDTEGLSPSEQRYLALLRESSVPIPLRRLARTLGLSARTLVEHLEPYLFLRGFVEMTPRGRQMGPA